jgi:hypothetical protein
MPRRTRPRRQRRPVAQALARTAPCEKCGARQRASGGGTRLLPVPHANWCSLGKGQG